MGAWASGAVFADSGPFETWDRLVGLYTQQSCSSRMKVRWVNRMNPIRAAFALISLVLCSACGHRYYAAQYQFHRKQLLPPSEMGRFRTADLEHLSRAQVIAFAPPEHCKDIIVGGERSKERVDLLSTDCGALMSELESAAQSAGFKVISWKALREPVQMHARERGVQLLIDVNRIAIHNIEPKELVATNVRVFEDFEDGHFETVRIPDYDRVASRCLSKPPILSSVSMLAAILDVKVIDAQAGSVLTRQVHVWPNRLETSQSAVRFYYGDRSQLPEKVICVGEPADPDWHKERSELEKSQNQFVALPTAQNVQNQSSDPEVIRYLLQRTSQQFIGSLVAIQEAYNTPSIPKTAGNKDTRHERPGVGKIRPGNALAPKSELDTDIANQMDQAINYVDQLGDPISMTKAVTLLKQITATKPGVFSAHYYLGRAQFGLGNCRAAIESFRVYYRADKEKRNRDPSAWLQEAEAKIRGCNQTP